MQNAHGPLLFYKENVKTFPLLSQLAKAIFCMLPASLASERLFRWSGRIVTTNRNSLDHKYLHLLKIIELCKKRSLWSNFLVLNYFFLNFNFNTSEFYKPFNLIFIVIFKHFKSMIISLINRTN